MKKHNNKMILKPSLHKKALGIFLLLCLNFHYAYAHSTEYLDEAEASETAGLDPEHDGKIYVQEGALFFKAEEEVVSTEVVTYHEAAKAETGIRKKKILQAIIPQKKESLYKDTTGIAVKPMQYAKPSAEDSSAFSASSLSGRSFIVASTNTIQQKHIHNQGFPYQAAAFVWYMLIVFSFYKSCRILFFLRGQLFQRPPPAF